MPTSAERLRIDNSQMTFGPTSSLNVAGKEQGSLRTHFPVAVKDWLSVPRKTADLKKAVPCK